MLTGSLMKRSPSNSYMNLYLIVLLFNFNSFSDVISGQSASKKGISNNKMQRLHFLQSRCAPVCETDATSTQLKSSP